MLIDKKESKNQSYKSSQSSTTFSGISLAIIFFLSRWSSVVSPPHCAVLLQGVKRFNLLHNVVACKWLANQSKPSSGLPRSPFAIIASILVGSVSLELFVKTLLQLTRNFSGLIGYSRPRYWRCLYSAMTLDFCDITEEAFNQLKKEICEAEKWKQWIVATFIASWCRLGQQVDWLNKM